MNPRRTEQPEDPEARKSYAVRLNKAGYDAIKRVADRDGISWSEAARRMLKYAAGKMPKGWH